MLLLKAQVQQETGFHQRMRFFLETSVDEYSWVPGGTIYGHNIGVVKNPVAMKWAAEPDGTQMLFVASQSAWYYFRGLSGMVMVGSGNVSGTTGLDFSLSPDGKHRLYFSTTSGLQEISWYSGTSFATWQMNRTPGIAVQKWEDDASWQVLYYATTYGVYEYYWQTTNNASLNSDTIIENKGTAHAFFRTTDPGFQTVYQAADTRIWEVWWGDGGAYPYGDGCLSEAQERIITKRRSEKVGIRQKLDCKDTEASGLSCFLSSMKRAK